MKKLIQKRADQLQPGDIMIANDGRLIILGATASDSCAPVRVLFIIVGGVRTRHVDLSPGSTHDVEAPELTPAQQHAEELLAAARKYLPLLVDHINENQSTRVADYDSEVIALRALLAKLAPPVPPTLEEALDALMTMADGASAVMAGTWDADTMQADRNAANAIIARARATGVLK